MDSKLKGALSLLAVCALLLTGAVLLFPQSEAAASDYDSLITTSDLTFDPYFEGLTGSKLSESGRFTEDQKYFGSSVSTVTWTDMAKDSEVRLPVYLPGTTQAIADVSSGGSYAGSYYLYGWSTTPGKTSGAGFYAAGDKYPVTGTDTRLYAIWMKTADGYYNYHDTFAPSTSSVGSHYEYKPVTNSKLKDSDNEGWLVCVSAFSNSCKCYVTSKPDNMACTVSGTGTLTVSFEQTFSSPGNYYVEFTHDTKSSGKYGHIWWVISVVPSDTQEYTYSYDTGLSSSVVPTGGSARYGQAFVLSDGFVGSTEIVNPNSSLTLAGWKLLGSSGTEAYFKLGQMVSMYEITSFASSGNLKFYADWRAADGVVVLSMDGASLKNVDAYIASQGSVITLPVPYDSQTQAQLQKQGCTLIGWNTLTQSDSTNGYGLWAPGSMLKMDSGVKKAQAVWWETSKLSGLKTVTFNVGSGSYGSAFAGTQKVPSGWFAYLPQYGIDPPSGYKFVGWSKTEGGTALDTDSIKVDDDLTLYAVYVASETDPDTPTYHRVTFNTNGGKGSVSVQSVKDGGYARQPTGITKDGYVLAGWSSSKGGLWDFSSDTVTDDLTLTASWELHWSYTVNKLTVTITVSSDYDRSVTVDWGDGTTDSKLTHTYDSVNASSLISVTSYASSSASDVAYTSYRTLSGLEGEFVPQTETVEVTFNAYPGKFPDGNTIRTFEIDKGKTVEEPTDTPVYDSEHLFACWTVNSVEFDFSQEIYYDTVLSASWSSVFVVSFDPGYSGAESIPSVSVKEGEPVTLPSPGARDGYVFGGWYTIAGGAGTKAGVAGESYIPARSLTLYARWTVAAQDTEVTVSFDVGKGSAVADKTVKLGESFELPDSIWTGYDLVAWYKASEKVGAPGEEYTPTESCTLKATWKDLSSGETVDDDDFIIPEAYIAIEETDGGWELHGSGKNAVQFQWYISSDGKKTWSGCGTGKDLLIPSSDYKDGTYWVKLITSSKTGHTATAYDSFTVGGDGDKDKDGGIIAFITENPIVVMGIAIAILTLIFIARWYI